jgi:hypothetical protein
VTKIASSVGAGLAFRVPPCRLRSPSTGGGLLEQFQLLAWRLALEYAPVFAVDDGPKVGGVGGTSMEERRLP